MTKVEQRTAAPAPILMDADETAALTTVARSTLHEWAARRESGQDVGPPVWALSRKNRRWERDEVLAWLAERRR